MLYTSFTYFLPSMISLMIDFQFLFQNCLCYWYKAIFAIRSSKLVKLTIVKLRFLYHSF